MRFTYILIIAITQLFSVVALASYLKIYHTGSGKESQTNTLSGSYSPTTSDELLKISPWEINSSAGRSDAGSGATSVITNSVSVGGSYRTESDFGISTSIASDTSNNKGVTSLKPSLTLEKKWTLDGSKELANAAELEDEFVPKIGVSIVASKKDAVQKGNKVIVRDFSLEQRTIDYGISYDATSWLAIDLSYSQFSYDQRIEDTYTQASAAVFTNQFGSSYSNLIESLNDKEQALRLTFKITTDTSIEISTLQSHSIALNSNSTDYTIEFMSSLFDTVGYSIGGTQTKTSDSSAATYSGDASLSYYF